MRRSITAIVGGLAALLLPAAPGLLAAPASAADAPVVRVAAVSLDPSSRVVGAYPWSLRTSADGGTVLWATDDDVTTVAAGQQWYLRHRASGVVTLVSAAPDGSPADGMHLVSGAALSADGGEVLLWDRDATNLVPGGGAASALLLRPVTATGLGATTVLRLPTVTTSTRGTARLKVVTAALSADGRVVTVGGQVPQGSAAPYDAVVRLDRATGTWRTLCGGESDGTRCRLALVGPGGRYAALDRWPAPTALLDTTTGREHPWPVDADGVPQPCVVAADESRLVCEKHTRQPDQPGGVDTTLVTRALPDLTVVATLRLRGQVTVTAASAGAELLAVESRRPDSRLSDAQRLDTATGTRTTVSVGPDGTPTTMAVRTVGLTADGAVLFTTPDRTLADRPAKSRLPRAYLATVG